MIKEQMIEVLKYSQQLEEVNIDKLFENWSTQKENIMRTFFKGDVSYRHPEKLIFELNNESKIERYGNFCDYVENLLGSDNDFYAFLECLPALDFFKNSLPFTYQVDESKKITKGTKVIKSFKYFLSNEKLLSDIQNKASALIQENKVEGYLVFSVHPLDFLSSSENTLNWRSCHSLDGEYRAGNLSYMQDSSTVICFLETGKYEKLPHFPESIPWNNKKWRCLLHFDESLNTVFAGRQYPFFSPGALEKVREIFLDHVAPKKKDLWGDEYPPTWSHWHNDYISDFNYEEFSEEDCFGVTPNQFAVINYKIWDTKKIIHDAPDSKHFNDLLRSSCYTKPYYMFLPNWSESNRDLNFTIGSKCNCIQCNNDIVTGWDTMLCDSCSEEWEKNHIVGTCDCCDTTISNSELYWVGADVVCFNCYNNETFTCEHCGERFYNSEKMWVEEKEAFFCSDCYYQNKGEE